MLNRFKTVDVEHVSLYWILFLTMMKKHSFIWSKRLTDATVIEVGDRCLGLLNLNRIGIKKKAIQSLKPDSAKADKDHLGRTCMWACQKKTYMFLIAFESNILQHPTNPTQAYRSLMGSSFAKTPKYHEWEWLD